MPFSLTSYILAFGYAGIFLAVFAESGFFLGFFLPGDSLLFTVGLLAATNQLNLFILMSVVAVAAIAGDSLGYWTGATFGRALLERFFKKENTQKNWIHRTLNAEYLDKTERFFGDYGARAIFLSRFVPIVRTFTPIFAGIAEMRYATFLVYNVVGGLVWSIGFLTASYYLGHIALVRQYVSIIILVIVLVSILPIIIGVFRRRRSVVKPLNENN
jgi:membrane-associated protein